METFIKEENENMNTEDSVENTIISITFAESTAVKEVKEKTEESEDPLQTIPGRWYNRYVRRERGEGGGTQVFETNHNYGKFM